MTPNHVITRAAELVQLLQTDEPSAALPPATLAQRIRQIEDWLATVPGRSETLWSCPDPAGQRGRFVAFRFHRAGDQHLISWDYDDDFTDPRDVSWKPLTEAPLQIRRAAFDTFSDLLKNVPRSL